MRKSMAVGALLLGCVVAFGFATARAQDKDKEEKFKPTVPCIDIKYDAKKGGATTVSFHGKKDPLSDEALVKYFDKLGSHQDKANGWAGRDAETGISENPVVVDIDALSDVSKVIEVLGAGVQSKVYRYAFGVSEYVEKSLAGAKAPDFDKLPDGYTQVLLPKDEGLSSVPSVPKERITLHVIWDAPSKGGSFTVAVDARGRIPVKDSWIDTNDLTSKQGSKRDEVVDNVKDAVASYIQRSGLKIEIAEIVFSRADRGAVRPWSFLCLAHSALERLNADREEAGEDLLTIQWPWERVVAEPPSPEQPPENPVEYPKDEPVQEDPTEDEKIVEDAKDDVNEDPSDKPNSDLAENPNGDSEKDGNPAKPAEAYKHRDKAMSDGDQPHTDRVKAALDWLKDHQNRQGFWSATEFSDDSVRQGAKKTYNIEFVKIGDANGDKGWEDTTDIGLTGLSLLAFAGAGYHHKDGDYRQTCRQGILYLRKVQDNDGCFGVKEDDHFVYNHAICTMALAEIYGLSGDKVLKPIVDKAIEFILNAQNPGLGWRYGVQPRENDSSVTSWMVLALKSCKLAGLEFDSGKCYADAAEWYKLVTVDVNGYPKCGYDAPGSNNARLRSASEYENNPCMEAMYTCSMLSMGKADLGDKTIKSMAKGMIQKDYLPVWEEHKIDLYYWYYASLALYHVGDEQWKTWEKSVSSVLTDRQRGFHGSDDLAELTSPKTLDEHGSWDPVGAWGTAGGRVYSTALGALTLQTYYRYLREED